MRFARPTLAIASPVVTVALVGFLMTLTFSSLAQPAPPTYTADGSEGSSAPAVTAERLRTTTTATLASTANLSAFYHLLEQAGLRSRLQRYPATYTVFAPTNGAMATMAAPMREHIHQIGAPAIKSVARVHIVPGTFMPSQLTDGSELETLGGRKLRVTRQADGTVLLDGIYQVRDTGLRTTNGIIYTLDTVIVP